MIVRVKFNTDDDDDHHPNQLLAGKLQSLDVITSTAFPPVDLLFIRFRISRQYIPLENTDGFTA